MVMIFDCPWILILHTEICQLRLRICPLVEIKRYKSHLELEFSNNTVSDHTWILYLTKWVILIPGYQGRSFQFQNEHQSFQHL